MSFWIIIAFIITLREVKIGKLLTASMESGIILKRSINFGLHLQIKIVFLKNYVILKEDMNDCFFKAQLNFFLSLLPLMVTDLFPAWNLQFNKSFYVSPNSPSSNSLRRKTLLKLISFIIIKICSKRYKKFYVKIKSLFLVSYDSLVTNRKIICYFLLLTTTYY